MVKLKERLLIVICMSLVSTLSFSSQWTGTVIEIKAVITSKAVLFKLSGKIESPTRCNENKMYAIDLGAPGGRAIFELVQLAYSEQRPIEAHSLNTCIVHWKSEGVKAVYLN